jgi:ribosome assembly protein 1
MGHNNCNSLSFTEPLLNDDTDHIQLTGFSMHRQERTTTSGKTRSGGVCLFVNNGWCAMSNIKEVSRYCSSEVEYRMISCGPHYLPSPQTDAGSKTTLKELYKEIS